MNEWINVENYSYILIYVINVDYIFYSRRS